MANTNHTPNEEPVGDEPERVEERRPNRGWNPERTTAFLRLLNEVVVLVAQLSDLFS